MSKKSYYAEPLTEAETFNRTIAEILAFRGSRMLSETAFIFLQDGDESEEHITYGELHQAAIDLSDYLLEIAKPGDRALMLFPPGLEFIKALFGCFYAGVIAVPAYPPRKNRSLERIRLLVNDSGASLILSTDDIRQSAERAFSDVPELKQITWLSTNPKSPIAQSPNRQIAQSPNRQIAQSPNRQIVKSPNRPIAQSPNRQIALLQYTSGSTGTPKGVMVTHRNIIRNAEYIRQSFALSRKSVSVTWLPSFHDMGLIDGVLVPVYTGFPGVILPPVSFLQKPVRWLKAITKYRGTHGGGPNFAFDLCAEGITEEEKKGLDLSSMETLYCGAEPIRKSTFERFVSSFREYGFSHEKLYPCYGMAETTLIITGPHAGRGPVYLCLSAGELEKNRIVPVGDQHPDARHLVGVGYPWIDTRVKIVDPETCRLLNDNEVGEIWVSGSIVTSGYWEKPDETKEAFSAEIAGDPGEKYLRTGDLGFFHDGELYISGRYKDLIIINGRNIYPQDIEYLTENSHPAIRKNASAAFPVDVGGEEKLVVVAEVERTAIRDLDVDGVCDRIRENIVMETELSVYAIQLLRTASILKTSSGKIQRKACREAFLQRKLDSLGESVLEMQFHEDQPEPTSVDIVNLEAWLMTWIHEKLKIPLNRIDLARPITAYGLTSMKAVALQQDFLERYGVSFPPYLFFEKSSLRELCEKAIKIIKEN
ncbi:MAG: AMP-binding protein [Bacteroidales bacterium]|jgi:acyl-CoA synthetase (AMP-forming)/AMP-acid ligase II|nr:AMP-binding protein [Bacteroidales bacterium]